MKWRVGVSSVAGRLRPRYVRPRLCCIMSCSQHHTYQSPGDCLWRCIHAYYKMNGWEELFYAGKIVVVSSAM